MSKVAQSGEIRLIPIERIEVLNTRERNQAAFDEIVENIRTIGLKKPITVTPRKGEDGAERYLLICGEGRLKAFCKLGESRIPALVVDVDNEDAHIMSLVENIARRRYMPLELLHGIRLLHEKGYEAQAICRKTGLSLEYVNTLLMLIILGEDRLMAAVQKGSIPINAARDIVSAGNDDKALQGVLQDAYESGQLRGRPLFEVRRLLQLRENLGKSLARKNPRKRSSVTTASLVRTYQKEVERQRMVVRKGSLTQQRLLLIVSAMRQLIADDHFVTLLRAEGLDTMPSYLAERIHRAGSKK
jgi:ParB family transcriptional regulator, chromosome partitioning protein